ncbi:unnamed protein product [Callosobruchus maculatus]|uniref:Fatty acyl-CoA reductase n=1 Tax=Callosobruchus maculatus TaxID=64391 RepID=A0A653CH34_CALMS|nr:unnamed protein product [Callosobruchus maculatus]
MGDSRLTESYSKNMSLVHIMLFDVIKKENPRVLDKVKFISGDVTELRLGISEEDEQMLKSKVNIIYHVAASVRFDDALGKAIITNVRSVREIIQLALRCINLEVFVHVSTAYCNVDTNFIDETLYPAPVNWRDAIELAESDLDLSLYTVKYISPWPNTYTFSKRIAEHVTHELCKDKIPAIIVRPSIVVHADKEPLPGWTDNLNGPFTLVVAGMIGVTSSIYAEKESTLDFISVDNVVKGMIIATWDRALRSRDKSNITIYNACSELLCKMGYFQIYDYETRNTVFFDKTLWFFDISIYPNYYLFYFSNFRHIAINTAIDLILRLQGRKPRHLRLVRTAYIAQLALHFFMANSFIFDTTNFDQLDSKLEETDRKAFMQTKRPKGKEDILAYAVDGLSGVKRFVFKEKDMSSEETSRRAKRFNIMRDCFKFTAVAVIIYMVLVMWVL